MKRISKILIAAVVGSALSGAPSQAEDASQKIESLLNSYQTALNASDTAAVMAVYANDAVFMPQHSKPQIGKDAIRSTYDAVFAAIDLDIAFVVDEVVLLSDNWAFARTRSEGTVVINANGAEVAEGNQELFLLQRQPDDQWKVARYIFSTTNPAQGG